MNKSFNVVVFGFGLFVLGIIGFVMLVSGGGTRGAAIAAESMMQNATAGNWIITRQHLTLPYANALHENELKQLAADLRLDKYTSIEWGEKTVSDQSAELKGNMTTADGETVSLVFSLEQAQGQWKIAKVDRDGERRSSVSKPIQLATKQPTPVAARKPATAPKAIKNAVATSASKATNKTNPSANPLQPPLDLVDVTAQSPLPVTSSVPSQDQVSKLVSKWTNEFQIGVARKDFTSFHSKTARDFQKQYSLPKFTQIFSPFIDQQSDLAWITKTQPKFKRPPMIDAKGIVFVSGEFIGPTPLDFEYRFVNEKGDWKPLEVSLALERANDGALPTLFEIKKMVKQKTLLFGRAVHDQDFSTFHSEQLASPFRKKFPIAKFAEIFKEFVNERAHLKWIADVEAEFEVLPTLNTDGVLQAQGSFPSTPPVDFRYAFIQEDDEWKMVFININVPPADEDNELANVNTGPAAESQQ